MKKTFILLTFALLLAGCGNQDDQFVTNNPACQYDNLPAQQLEELKNYPLTTEMKLKPEKGDTIALVTTNYGEIKILLYMGKAPETVKNFMELARAGKYDDSIFHRVIDCFMVQGGDFENKNGTGGYSYKGPGTRIMDEFGEGLEHLRGAVSMANSGPNTAGSQFFIVQADNGTPWLDGKHAVFGFVYEGMDFVDEMAKAEKTSGDKPLEDIVIEKVEIKRA